jgi:hypothetical protein
VGYSGVVRNAVDPSAEGAAEVEGAEAAPQGRMDFLEQILTAGEVSLIAGREAFQR